MCKVVATTVAVISLVLINWHIVAAQHWSSLTGSELLSIDSTKCLVRFDESVDLEQREQLLEGIDRVSSVISKPYADFSSYVCSLKTSNGFMLFADSLVDIPGVASVEYYYLRSNGRPYLIDNEICVWFYSWVSRTTVDSLMLALECTATQSSRSEAMLLRSSARLPGQLLDYANELAALDECLYAHPNAQADIRPCAYKAYDYYSPFQDHVKKVVGSFNEASVWDFHGVDSEIVVAVLDEGVAAHEDLPAGKVMLGWDFVADSLGAGPYADNGHGMGCAGLIAASHTTDSLNGLDSNSGIISVGPHLKIYPIRIYYSTGPYIWSVSEQRIADAIDTCAHHGASVYSFSWALGGLAPVIEQQMNTQYSGGRVFICAAGNDSSAGLVYPASSEYTIAVGAVDLDDSRWSYSSYGNGLDVVAPAGDANHRGSMWSLDIVGSDGENDGAVGVDWDCSVDSAGNDKDYNCKFGGTSSAAPIVAGAAALLYPAMRTRLSHLENTAPNSEWADSVKSILFHSAVRELADTIVNPPHSEYGWGRVDAFRAVLSISHGDVNNDGLIGDSSDLGALTAFLFSSTPIFPHVLMGDVNCDAIVDSSDLGYLTNYLFGSGDPPVNPCYELDPIYR